MTKICQSVLRLASAAALFAASSGYASASCGAHKDMVTVLAKKYLESPHAIGTVHDDKLVELFVSSNGSWTILVTRPNGQSCIMAAGQNWEQVPPNLRNVDPAA